MAHETIKVSELVELAVSHHWSVPEFQRGFVWKSTQVRDLAESLWLDFPIGSLLVWRSDSPQEERIAKDGVAPSLWIVDGQQRTTALAILFGRKPYWWTSSDEWNRVLKRYDVRFDVDANDEPFFLVANAAIRRAKGNRYVPLRELLVIDVNKPEGQKRLETLAKDIKSQGLCDGIDAMGVYTKLDGVRKIREKEIVKITIGHELEDVVEIFARLNSRGTRVTEADIYLGIVASKSPGWVREEFLPFLTLLNESGFYIDPNLLFRTVTALGVGKVRFRDIDDKFWEPDSIRDAWKKSQVSWKKLIQRLQEHGILSDEPLPTAAALVTLIALVERFPDDPDFDPAIYWMLQASRFSRYSGSGTTALDEDLKDVKAAVSLTDAVTKLTKRFPVQQPFAPEDFQRDYTDGKFGRFLLYLMAYGRKAQDWNQAGMRLGFDGSEILKDFKPQWHHIYPRGFLESNHVDEEKIHWLSNIAVIGPTINIRISAQDPMKYLDKYKITDEKLKQQFIELPRSEFTIENYERFLKMRSESLVEGANGFLLKLSGHLPPDVRPNVPDPK